jgi:hypothetical protein
MARYLVDEYQRRALTTYQITAESGFSVDAVRVYTRRARIPVRWIGFTDTTSMPRYWPS